MVAGAAESAAGGGAQAAPSATAAGAAAHGGADAVLHLEHGATATRTAGPLSAARPDLRQCPGAVGKIRESQEDPAEPDVQEVMRQCADAIGKAVPEGQENPAEAVR